MQKVKQICVISGKGGTGKTTITASLASLMPKNKILIDCDVDASNLPIIIEPESTTSEPFYAGRYASILRNKCISCGKCFDVCKFDAVKKANSQFEIDEYKCEGCKVCALVCPVEAININTRLSGETYISKTRFGDMVHAELNPGQENSGKLVTAVRDKGLELAEKNNAEYILIDGPPGTGCPVIASLSGVDLALVIIEPTITGLHALERIVKVAKFFNIKCLTSINKSGLNENVSNEIIKIAVNLGAPVIAKIDFNISIAQSLGKKILPTELEEKSIYNQFFNLWMFIKENL